jgi:hypothetical protein
LALHPLVAPVLLPSLRRAVNSARDMLEIDVIRLSVTRLIVIDLFRKKIAKNGLFRKKIAKNGLFRKKIAKMSNFLTYFMATPVKKY